MPWLREISWLDQDKSRHQYEKPRLVWPFWPELSLLFPLPPTYPSLGSSSLGSGRYLKSNTEKAKLHLPFPRTDTLAISIQWGSSSMNFPRILCISPSAHIPNKRPREKLLLKCETFSSVLYYAILNDTEFLRQWTELDCLKSYKKGPPDSDRSGCFPTEESWPGWWQPLEA